MKNIRLLTGMTQKEFAEYFKIPQRSIENWEGGKRTPPTYLIELIEYKLERENKKMKIDLIKSSKEVENVNEIKDGCTLFLDDNIV